eukprot:6302195-Alexandrium_andersonii.AAC.1
MLRQHGHPNGVAQKYLHIELPKRAKPPSFLHRARKSHLLWLPAESEAPTEQEQSASAETGAAGAEDPRGGPMRKRKGQRTDPDCLRFGCTCMLRQHTHTHAYTLPRAIELA